MTKPTRKLPKVSLFGCLHVIQVERITTWKALYQEVFTAKTIFKKREQNSKKKRVIRKKIAFFGSNHLYSETIQQSDHYTPILCTAVQRNRGLPTENSMKSSIFSCCFFPTPKIGF